MTRIVALFALVLGGCLAPAALVPMPHNQDGGRRPARVGPISNRCPRLVEPNREKECEQIRFDAINFVRRLAVDDQLCLQGNPLSDGVTGRCKVRAFVEDVGPKSIKLEIRHADPGTGFQPMADHWYHEDALVDLYLDSWGFEARPPEPAAAK
jgi:hypothetical protein